MGRLSEHNLVAVFTDQDKAGEALLSLGRAGIESDDISFIGRDVDDVSSDADTRIRDSEVIGTVAKKAGAGVAAGSILGAIAGAAAFAIPGIGPVVGAGIWGGLAAGAAAGGAVGGMVAGVGSIDLNEDWELTFGDALRSGKVVLAVHATEGDTVDKARRVLDDSDAESIQMLDAEGRQAE